MSDCKPRITPKCGSLLTPAPSKPVECPTWEVCLPFGGRLYSNGGCVNYDPGNPPPDGVYSKITIVNGCIVSAELADIPVYTPTPCAVVPAPCDGEGGASAEPSPTVGNLFQYDASGRPLVRLTVRAGDGISVTGNGTTSDPLVITNTREESENIVIQGTGQITVTGAGTVDDPYRIAHASHTGGTYGGFTFDAQGHLTGYTPAGSQAFVTGIIAGDGMKVESDPKTGISTVALADPATVLTGKFPLGGFDVELFRNRIVNATKTIDIPPGVYEFGEYSVTLNAEGSITSISKLPPAALDPVRWTRQFTTKGEMFRQVQFTMQRDSSLRVVYYGALPAETTLYIDSQAIAGVRTSSTQFDALPIAVYGKGQHTLSLQTLTAGGFTAGGFLDISLTEVLQ